jgi:hypothetical protein
MHRANDVLFREGALFEVRERGVLTRSWDPIRISVSDATGNSVAGLVGYYRYPSSNGERWFGGLCRREVWKLRVEFARALPLSAAPDFLWTVRNIVAPLPGVAGVSHAKITRQGVTLALLGTAGAGAHSHFPRPDSLQNVSFARVSVRCPSGGLRLTLVRATDDRGRMVLPASLYRRGEPSQIYLPWQRDYDFHLKVPPDARKLNLTFAVHRTRTFEFKVKPT